MSRQASLIPSYKTVLLGDASVGKTSIILRLTRDLFSENTDTTIGAAFCPYIVDVGNQRVKFELWDTAGQERFSSLAPMYYRGAAAAIVVFDVTKATSFDRAVMWIQQLRMSNPNILICLTANKYDLMDKDSDLDEMRRYAENESLFFYQTSAKTGQNVRDMFSMIAQKLVESTTLEKQAQKKNIRLEAKTYRNPLWSTFGSAFCSCNR